MNKKVFFIAAFLVGSCAYTVQAQDAAVASPQAAVNVDQPTEFKTQQAFLDAIKKYDRATDDQTQQQLIRGFKVSMKHEIATGKKDIVKANEKGNEAAIETATELYEQKVALYNALITETRGKNDKTAVITILKRYASLM